jgi:prepilin-type N-terminal cleavage/methylation domain-containing protein
MALLDAGVYIILHDCTFLFFSIKGTVNLVDEWLFVIVIYIHFASSNSQGAFVMKPNHVMPSRSSLPIHKKNKKKGFTLVELLVVIVIIGILIALLLPAIQAARESARRLQCSGHLKQLGTAALTHQSAQNFYPSGGWGWLWVGDPDRGFSTRQPGGWIYNLLPYMEMGSIHDLTKGKIGPARKAAGKKLCEMPIEIVNCPSRRQAALIPIGVVDPREAQPHCGGTSDLTTDTLASVARSDYAANSGSAYTARGFRIMVRKIGHKAIRLLGLRAG